MDWQLLHDWEYSDATILEAATIRKFFDQLKFFFLFKFACTNFIHSKFFSCFRLLVKQEKAPPGNYGTFLIIFWKFIIKPINLQSNLQIKI